MSFLSASPDSNPTRTQLRLVVLGQWVRAGLALARGAKAGRGVIGGAVALWQVFQAVRLAILLAQRLSQARGALSIAAPETSPGEAAAPGWEPLFEDPACDAAFFRDALIALERTIRDALGLASERCGRFATNGAAAAMAERGVPRVLGRLTPPPARPPGRPPPLEPRLARRRRRCAPRALKTFRPPIAAPAIGRFRLAAA
jgi:hypothetical protein